MSKPSINKPMTFIKLALAAIAAMITVGALSVHAEAAQLYTVKFVVKSPKENATPNDAYTADNTDTVTVHDGLKVGDTVSLPSSNPADFKNNKTNLASAAFEGWYTKSAFPSGSKISTADYTVADTNASTDTEDRGNGDEKVIYLYAKYTYNTITFNVKPFTANTASTVAAAYQSHAAFASGGSEIKTLPTPPPVLNTDNLRVLQFEGWTTNSSGTGPIINSRNVYEITSNPTALYAVYTPMYLVTFMTTVNASSSTTWDTTFYQTTVLKDHRAAPPTASPANFVDWYPVTFTDNAVAPTIDPFDFGNTPITADTVLHAYTSTTARIVTFKSYEDRVLKTFLLGASGGLTTGAASQTEAIEAIQSANAISPPTGKMFDRWYYMNGATKTYITLSNITATFPTKSLVLYPEVKDAYTVEFVTNGVPVASQYFARSGSSFDIKNPTTISPPVPQRTGYTFSRWSLDPNGADFFGAGASPGSAKTYTVDGSHMQNNVLKIYAVWNPIRVGYSVAFWVEKPNLGTPAATAAATELGGNGISKTNINNYDFVEQVDITTTIDGGRYLSISSGTAVNENTLVYYANNSDTLTGATATLKTLVDNSNTANSWIFNKLTPAASGSDRVRHSKYDHIETTAIDGNGKTVINVFYIRKAYAVYINPRLSEANVYAFTSIAGSPALNGDTATRMNYTGGTNGNPAGGGTADPLANAGFFAGSATTKLFYAKFEQDISKTWPKSADIDDDLTSPTTSFLQYGWYIKSVPEVPHNDLTIFSNSFATAAELNARFGITNGGSYVGSGKEGLLVGVRWLNASSASRLDRVHYKQVTNDDLAKAGATGAFTALPAISTANTNLLELYNGGNTNLSTSGATNADGTSRDNSGITYAAGTENYNGTATYPKYLRYEIGSTGNYMYFERADDLFMTAPFENNQYGSGRNVSSVYAGVSVYKPLMGAQATDTSYYSYRLFGSVTPKTTIGTIGSQSETRTKHWFLYAMYERNKATLTYDIGAPAGVTFSQNVPTSATVNLTKLGTSKSNTLYEKTTNTNNAVILYGDTLRSIVGALPVADDLYTPTTKPVDEKGITYTFGGWYPNKSFAEGTQVTNLNQTVTDNTILYARWLPDIVHVGFKESQSAATWLFGTVNPTETPLVLYGGDVIRTKIDEGTPKLSALFTAAAAYQKNVNPNSANAALTFDGWFYQQDGHTKELILALTPDGTFTSDSLETISRIFALTADLTIWAEWSPGRFEVRFYDKDPGKIAIPAGVNYVTGRSVVSVDGVNHINETGAVYDDPNGSRRRADGLVPTPEPDERTLGRYMPELTTAQFLAANPGLKFEDFYWFTDPTSNLPTQWWYDDEHGDKQPFFSNTPVAPNVTSPKNDVMRVYARYYHKVVFYRIDLDRELDGKVKLDANDKPIYKERVQVRIEYPEHNTGTVAYAPPTGYSGWYSDRKADGTLITDGTNNPVSGAMEPYKIDPTTGERKGVEPSWNGSPDRKFKTNENFYAIEKYDTPPIINVEPPSFPLR